MIVLQVECLSGYAPCVFVTGALARDWGGYGASVEAPDGLSD